MLKLFLWLRYLRKKRIVLLSIAAVTVSVALLIVVASLFNGFINAFENSTVEIIGDAVIMPPEKFAKYPVLIEQLERLGSVEAATPVLSTQGLLHLGPGNVRAASVWGIEPNSRAAVTAYGKTLLRQAGQPGPPSFDVPGFRDALGGFVGIGTIAEPNERTDKYDTQAVLSEMVGKQVFLTTGTMTRPKDPNGRPEAPQFKKELVPFRISDIAFSGVYDLDKRFVFLPIDGLQQALYPDEEGPMANAIQIKLAPGIDPDLALAEIRGMWKFFAEHELEWDSYRVAYLTDIDTARQMQSQYTGELRKQMGVLLVIFGVVSFSVVVLIFCVFYMIVRLKQKDIAIIKSCGAGITLVWTFVGFGLCVGVIGSALGTLCGYIITKNINVIEDWIRMLFGLKLWDSSVYMFSKIPNQVDWPSVLSIVVLATLAAAVGAIMPAIIAARCRPVEILRYE